jgi:hypothetical protein
LIEIIIDGVTECLIERATGKKVATKEMRVHPKRGQFPEMHFDWTFPERQGAVVYALKIDDDTDDEVQGLIAFHEDRANTCYVGDLLESNPANIGKQGRYIGVGAHLTAFACKMAKEAGYDAYFFEAKTDLIEHYENTLGARQIGRSQQMYIMGAAFNRLIGMYYKEA